MQISPNLMIDDPKIWASTPALFAHYCSGNRWYPAEHLVMLSDVLMDVADGKIRHLMVTIPPRHGKSTLISHYYPVWYLGRYPDNRIIGASYEADFAAQWGYKARNTMSEHGKALFGLSVSGDSSARDRWDIAGHSGGMNTAGVGGAITGKGSNLLLIDDPVKNAEEANSKTYRDKTYEWYKSTAYTRLEPGGSVVLIMTRWHSDDLAGRLLQDEPDMWTVINLPAIAEENDMLGRQPGEALFPKRFNVDALMEIKKTVGPYWWNALYQQRPSALEGTIFKKQYLKYATLNNGIIDLGDKKVVLSECLIFQTCDPAVSTKASADYFVLGTWALTKSNDLIWLDDIRTRLEGPDQINLFKQAHLRWKPAVQLVESVGVGKTLFQMLKREGLPVVELKAETDKVTRALPAAARMEAGCIYLLKTLPDLADIEDELLSFPKGSHDDIVDVLSHAVQYAISKSNLNTKLDLSALMQTTSRRI